MSPTLPEEMVSDVLCRLPVKSLLRFRCASKPFCSLIDHPHFAKLHLNRANSTNTLILRIWNRPLLSIDLLSLDRAVEMVEIEHPLKTLRGDTDVIGSCNGLLCLNNSTSESQIVIWNMATRKHHRLPHIHTDFPNKPDIHSHHVAYGFGFDSVHHDYKLVRIVRFRNTLDGEVMVYSLKSNSWRMVGGFPYDLEGMRSVGRFAEGALHWMVDRPFVVAFDLASEELREIRLPEGALGEKSYQLLWWVFEGRLCAILTRIAGGAEILVLKHNGSSWDKLLSISDPRLTVSDSIVPMAYLSNGNELLLLQDDDKFVRYDLKTNKAKNVMIHVRPHSFVTMPYVESLVNPLPMVNATVGKHKGKNNATKRDDFLSKGFKLVL